MYNRFNTKEIQNPSYAFTCNRDMKEKLQELHNEVDKTQRTTSIYTYKSHHSLNPPHI